MFAGRHIAVVEDDEIMGRSIVQRLEVEHARVTWLRHVHRALGALRTPAAPIDAVVCDILLPDGDGEALFTALAASRVPPPFLFITGRGRVDQAVRLMRSGAADYMIKPFDMPSFLDRLRLVMPERATVAEPLLGASPAAVRVEGQIKAAAAEEAGPVLILGAAGTGKLRIARAIHAMSDRCSAPLIVHDVTRDGTEPDLGALADVAGDGVLVLTALERLGPAGQDALSQWLDRAPADPRLILCARLAITDCITAGAFRADLRHRLRKSEIAVPPLSERTEDAVWLVHRLFGPANARRAVPLRGIAGLTDSAIRAHSWPGNGREVRARLIRAVDAAREDWLFPADLFPERQLGQPDLLSLAEARDAAERAQILTALDRSRGQMAEAARLLKVSRTTLWEKLQKLGL